MRALQRDDDDGKDADGDALPARRHSKYGARVKSESWVAKSMRQAHNVIEVRPLYLSLRVVEGSLCQRTC